MLIAKVKYFKYNPFTKHEKYAIIVMVNVMKRNGEKVMQNLTIEQLNEIISTMDLEKIKAGIEQHGFRCASKHGKLEFDLMKILEQERTTATEEHQELFGDACYWAEVYENVKACDGYDFIIVTQLDTKLNMPEHVDIYTDAPINEEYEKAMEEVKKCKRCGNKFKGYELWEMNGNHYCMPCFREVFSKKARTR